MWEPIPQPCQKGPTLTFDSCEEPIQHTCSKRISTYIWHMWGTNPTYMFKKDLHLHPTHVRNQSNMHVWKGSALTSDTCEEPIQHACSKGICTYIWHMRGTNSTCMFKRALHLHLTHVRNQSNMHVWKGYALTFNTWEEPIQHACLKGLALTSHQVGTNPTVISEWPPVPDWAT